MILTVAMIFRKMMVMMVSGHSNFDNITTVDWMILIMMSDIFMVLTVAMFFVFFRKMVVMMVTDHSNFGNVLSQWSLYSL